MVRAGKLRHRVQLQSNTTSVDAAGQVEQSWTTYRTCFAEVIYKGGSETIRGEQVDANLTAVIRIRYPSAGTFPEPEHRVTWDGHTFNIDSVQRRDTHEREVWLYVKEAA
jgi:SPP1 family predicted phage head-tail adaptor